MRNYIKAELYRNLNRVYFWCMTGVIAVIGILVNASFKISAIAPLGLEYVFDTGIRALGLPIFIIPMIIEMVTAEEQKNQTLKNVVSFGMPRNKLILSKLIATIILAVISAVIILTVYFGSGAILFEAGKGFSVSIVKDFGLKLLAAASLWIGTISIGNLLAIVFKSSTSFAFGYTGLFLFFNKIIYLLSTLVSDKFKYVYDYLITIQFNNLVGKTTGSTIMHAALVGIIYTIIFTIINVIYFNKAEIR